MSRARKGPEDTASPGGERTIQLDPQDRPEQSDLKSGNLGHIGRLRPFLSLDDLKLHLVALLQALVAFGGDGAVVNEYIRSIVSAEEAVSFGVVEPLDGAFETFHVRPSFLRIAPKRRDFGVRKKMCTNCAAHRGCCQGSASHINVRRQGPLV